VVSIHAPAQGATPVVGHLADGLIVSIHAPAQGATYFSLLFNIVHKYQLDPRTFPNHTKSIFSFQRASSNETH
ncbi:MAG: hypothetical protein JW884_12915, partial [Deltaproteobacteria bacterium]|nr:hypothetical protein [Deltaproteobacteria bacterium]